MKIGHFDSQEVQGAIAEVVNNALELNRVSCGSSVRCCVIILDRVSGDRLLTWLYGSAHDMVPNTTAVACQLQRQRDKVSTWQFDDATINHDGEAIAVGDFVLVVSELPEYLNEAVALIVAMKFFWASGHDQNIITAISGNPYSKPLYERVFKVTFSAWAENDS